MQFKYTYYVGGGVTVVSLPSQTFTASIVNLGYYHSGDDGV